MPRSHAPIEHLLHAVTFATIEEGEDDLPNDTSTPVEISVGDIFDGFIFEGDEDWIRIELTAGQDIAILAYGNLTLGPLFDPQIELRDQDGNVLRSNADGGPGETSLINFTVSTSGTYYISVHDQDFENGGSYDLQVVEGTVGTERTIGRQIAEGFHNSNGEDAAAWDLPQNKQLTIDTSALSGQEARLVRNAIKEWEKVTGIEFVETNSNADITFEISGGASTASGSITRGGSISLPSPYGSGDEITSATVSIGSQLVPSDGASFNSKAFLAIMAAIGQALGLGQTTSATEGDLFLNASWQMSIFSDNDQSEGDFVNADAAYPTTLMAADIYAIRELYGLESVDVYQDDTTYGANANVRGHMKHIFEQVFDGETRNPNTWDGEAFAFTIFDTGGTDTIDVSTLSMDQKIDLRQGGISNVAGYVGNMVIADGSGTIENATGGRGDDILLGNAARNILIGNNGNDTLIGFLGNDRIEGGKGKDIIRGGLDKDKIFGAAGNDELYGGTDADKVHGDAGNDFVAGRRGNDELFGGAGRDELRGGDGRDTLMGEAGNDLLAGGQGNDDLRGGDGADDLNGNAGNDDMRGGKGNDRYVVDASGDQVIENNGNGNDTVQTSLRVYTLDANIENLEMTGSDTSKTYRANGNNLDNMITGSTEAKNVMFGQRGDDTLIGGSKNDEINGDDGTNTGEGGNDTLRGGGGNDFLHSGVGDDRLYGDEGADTVLGGNGDDQVWGGKGNDLINGDLGDDTLRGGKGNDRIIGRDGNDTLIGNEGRDTFYFNANKNVNAVDVIRDFEANRDKIEFEFASQNVSVSDSGNNTTIRYTIEGSSSGGTIILENVDLDENDITFVFV